MRIEREKISIESCLPPNIAKWYQESPKIYSRDGIYLGRSLQEKSPVFYDKLFKDTFRILIIPALTSQIDMALGGNGENGLVIGVAIDVVILGYSIISDRRRQQEEVLRREYS